MKSESSLEDFISSIYDQQNFADDIFNKKEIIDGCKTRFIRGGYDSMEDVKDNCGDIKDDYLHLRTDVSIPNKLIIAIYRVIREMKSEPEASATTAVSK